MSLVAPQDNTLVMYCNRNAALSDRTFVLHVLNLILVLASKKPEPLLQSRGGHLPGPQQPSPAPVTLLEKDRQAARGCTCIKGGGGKAGRTTQLHCSSGTENISASWAAQHA